MNREEGMKNEVLRPEGIQGNTESYCLMGIEFYFE